MAVTDFKYTLETDGMLTCVHKDDGKESISDLIFSSARRAIAVAPCWPLWPPVTDQTTVPTAHGPVAKVPGRWGCGSAPGRRVSSVSGRI